MNASNPLRTHKAERGIYSVLKHLITINNLGPKVCAKHTTLPAIPRTSLRADTAVMKHPLGNIRQIMALLASWWQALEWRYCDYKYRYQADTMASIPVLAGNKHLHLLWYYWYNPYLLTSSVVWSAQMTSRIIVPTATSIRVIASSSPSSSFFGAAPLSIPVAQC